MCCVSKSIVTNTPTSRATPGPGRWRVHFIVCMLLRMAVRLVRTVMEGTNYAVILLPLA